MDIEAIRAGALDHLPGADLEDEDLAEGQMEKINLAGANLIGTNFSQ
ncbi:MAG: pentapeptide repeat-containing protein, partial [Cyanobacteriota bacterium]|nr:pentapeptide repeat-containing protein [Cyanobacteriota bacterium]